MKEKDERKKEGFKGEVTYAWEVSQEIESHYKDFCENKNVVQPPIQPTDSLKLNPLACGGDKHYKRTLKNIEQLHSIYRPYVIVNLQ